MQRVMFVVAHPDDEFLMGGGLIDKCREKRVPVAVVTIASDASARGSGSGPEKIAAKQLEVFKKFEIRNKYNYTGSDSNLINENHLAVVQFIEKCITSFDPDLIITHYPKDTHSDHKCVSAATQEAFRIKQRKDGRYPLRELWYGEVLSSTDWSLQEPFHPNVWVDLGYRNVLAKIEGLEIYDQVIRSVPHPRSVENIKALARVRGSQCGAEYAEAFQQVFRVYD